MRDPGTMRERGAVQAENEGEHDPNERGYWGPYGGRFMPEAMRFWVTWVWS